MVEVFKYVDKFFASLTNYLTYNMIFIIFLGLFLFTVFCVICLTSHSYEAKLIKAIDKLNSYFIDNPQINEENLVSFNAKMKGKKVPKQLRKNWQQFVLYREAKASAYMSFENCVSNPIKNSTYKRDLKLMNKIAWILSMCALILNCYYCFETVDIASALSGILLTPIIILLVNYIIQIFLTLKHSAIVSDLFQNYQYFEVNIDKATETLPEYVDYEVLFDRNEIKKGIPILYTYLQKRAEEEQRELERARLKNVEHEKFNFDDQGVAASLVLERAMQEAENYIAERKKYNQDIGQINSDMTQEDMNYREITKEYNRQMQVSKETFANFKSQLEEVSSTIEANYLKKQQQQELDRQRNLERDFDTATEKHKKVIEGFHAELDTVDKFIAQSRKNLEDAMKSEFSTYSSKVYDEAKRVAEQRVKDKLDKSKADIIELEERLVDREQELKNVYDENLAVKEELDRVLEEYNTLTEAVNDKKSKKVKKVEEPVYVPSTPIEPQDEEPEDAGMLKTIEEEQPEVKLDNNFTQYEEQDFETETDDFVPIEENDTFNMINEVAETAVEEAEGVENELEETPEETPAETLEEVNNESDDEYEEFVAFGDDEEGFDESLFEDTDYESDFDLGSVDKEEKTSEEPKQETNEEDLDVQSELEKLNEIAKMLDGDQEISTEQTEESIEKPVSRRGRPRKVVEQVQEGEKKKPGRPRKEVSEKTDSPVKKRGRGRPKKVVETTEESKVLVKKGRGRPKKEGGVEITKAPIKKGRGRPKKVQNIAVASKTGRGRPKKVVETTEASKALVKKGRGRPKKVENIVVSDNKNESNKNVATPVKSTRTENKIANEIKDIDAYLKEIDDAIAAENAILEETQKELAKKAKFRNKK